MSALGAVVFLSRVGGRTPMLEDVIFSPAALWLAEGLRRAGVERFFVVCHGDDQAQAERCFPVGTLFDSGEKRDRLVAFLKALPGKVALIQKPMLLGPGMAEFLFTDSPKAAIEGDGDTGVCRADGKALAAALAEGEGLAQAIAASADTLKNGSIWFQGGTRLNPDSWMDRANAEQQARGGMLVHLVKAGVRVIDMVGTWVDPTVTVGAGTVLLPGTILRGNTVIGEGCEIGPNTMIRDCTIGRNVTVNSSQLTESVVEDGAKIGPFAYVRPHCHIGPGVKVGDFVELKNSVIGAETKISHLTYVGDSDVGSGVNFGCGTITVNYDGAQKFRTTIGDNAFIGCNTNLVAPVRVGEGAYTAAGSTITDDVPADSLAIARSTQTVKKNWAGKRKK